MTTQEILQKAIDSGIIDLAYLQDQMKTAERKRLLEKHKSKFWQTKGRWRTYLPDPVKGRRTVDRKTKKEVEDVVVEYYRSLEEYPLVDEIFEEWARRKLDLKKISAATYLRYHQEYRRYFAESFGKKQINELTPESILDFLEEQPSKHNLTSKAFSNLKTIMRGMLKRAKRRGFINFNIDLVISELDSSDHDFKHIIRSDEEEVFSEAEYERIMLYLAEHQDQTNLGIMLMFVTGMRIGELVVLKHDDFKDGMIEIHRTETREFGDDGKYHYNIKDAPKTFAGIRKIILPRGFSWLYDTINSLNPDKEFIFMNGRHRLTTNTFRTRLRNLCDELHIVRKSPHKIRKTYGSILLDAGVDKNFVTSQMGHSNILVTEKHYHRNRKSVDTKADILSRIPEFQIVEDEATTMEQPSKVIDLSQKRGVS